MVMKKFLTLIFLLLSSYSLHAQLAVGVPHIADPGVCTDRWLVTTVSYVQQARGKYIESKTQKGTQFDILFRDFHLALPASAAVHAIEIRITRKKKGNSEVKDVTALLLKPVNDSVSLTLGPNMAEAKPWSDGLSTILYSFPSSALAGDGFSFIWTAHDLNSPAFGLFLETSVGNGTGAAVLIDQVELTVKYTDPTNNIAPADYTGKKTVFRNLGRKYQVYVEKEGEYQFIVRNSAGQVVQQTSIQGGKTVIVPLSEKSKGRCVITVEGREYKYSEQAMLQ